MRLAGLCVFALFSLALGACAGDGRPKEGGAQPASETPAPQIGGAPTFAASTPQPAQTGRPSLRSTIDGSCRITAQGAEIRVEYSVSAFGATMLNRVKLLQDGAEVEDSGPLQQREFRRVATFKVQPGDRRTYRVAAEAPGAAGSNVQSTVQCGTQPTPSPGPRA